MKWLARIIVAGTIIFLALKVHQQSDALTACLGDVQNKCGGVVSYAISLESENAKINRYLQRCLDASR
jgi:hypothetical protein